MLPFLMSCENNRGAFNITDSLRHQTQLHFVLEPLLLSQCLLFLNKSATVLQQKDNYINTKYWHKYNFIGLITDTIQFFYFPFFIINTNTQATSITSAITNGNWTWPVEPDLLSCSPWRVIKLKHFISWDLRIHQEATRQCFLTGKFPKSVPSAIHRSFILKRIPLCRTSDISGLSAKVLCSDSCKLDLLCGSSSGACLVDCTEYNWWRFDVELLPKILKALLPSPLIEDAEDAASLPTIP